MTWPVHEEHAVLMRVCCELDAAFIRFDDSALFVAQPAAVRVLDHPLMRQSEILGLDGYTMHGTDVRPRLDLIYDRGREAIGRSPQAVVADWPQDSWVEITFELPG